MCNKINHCPFCFKKRVVKHITKRWLGQDTQGQLCSNHPLYCLFKLSKGKPIKKTQVLQICESRNPRSCSLEDFVMDTVEEIMGDTVVVEEVDPYSHLIVCLWSICLCRFIFLTPLLQCPRGSSRSLSCFDMYPIHPSGESSKQCYFHWQWYYSSNYCSPTDEDPPTLQLWSFGKRGEMSGVRSIISCGKVIIVKPGETCDWW